MPPARAVSGGWMLRHAVRMRTDPLGFLVDCAAPLGALVELPIPRQRVFVVNDPDAITRVLQGNHSAYGKQTIQYRSLALVTGEGLLVSEGEEWLRGRRLVQPAFHQRTLDAVGDHVADAIDRLFATWAALLDGLLDGAVDGAVVDVDAAMMRTTLEVVGHALFATDLGPEADRIVEAVVAALDQVIARARSPLPLPRTWPTPGNRRLKRSVDQLDASVAELVRARRAVSTGAAASGADLLGLLLDPSSSASDQEVRDQVVTLVVAGHETVASALTWAWWLVAGHGVVADRLAAESAAVLGGRRPTFADVARLPYARQVLDEALRLYPPAWVVTRRVLADDVLAGVPVPAGALLIMSTYALHRNPAVWDRPDAFDPDRFAQPASAGSAGSAGSSGGGRRGYLPFGAGPRMCVGRELALVEGVLVLSALAGRYRFQRTPGQVVRADALVTVRPRGGLPLRIRRR
ncbi:MAG TPA: cytochrome P450 [Actinomycetes bacterium]